MDLKLERTGEISQVATLQNPASGSQVVLPSPGLGTQTPAPPIPTPCPTPTPVQLMVFYDPDNKSQDCWMLTLNNCQAGWRGELPVRAGAMMLDRLRLPFLVVAILLSLALVLAEAGLPRYQEPLAQAVCRCSRRPKPTPLTNLHGKWQRFFPPDQAARLKKLLGEGIDDSRAVSLSLSAFGFGLRYLWLVDGLLLFSLLLIGLGVCLPPALQARIQGPLTMLYALFVIIMAIVLILEALAATILMLSLLLAFPFGTIAYWSLGASLIATAQRQSWGCSLQSSSSSPEQWSWPTSAFSKTWAWC